MPSDFDIHYRFKNLPDDHLITALTVESYKYTEQAHVIIRKILQERDVSLEALPLPNLHPPAHAADNSESEGQGLFSANNIESTEDFIERAEIIFKDRNIDPDNEEDKQRFDVSKESSINIKKTGSLVLVISLGLYYFVKLIYFLVR